MTPVLGWLATTLSTLAPERFPAPMAVTVVFVVLWALLLGLVVLSAGGAQRLEVELDELERHLRGASPASPDAPS